jgi:hypothetical protein
VPVVLLCAAEYPKVLFERLVGSFTSSICLRVIRRADVLMDVEKSAEFCGKFRREVDISV